MPKRTRTTRRLEVWLKDTDLALFVLNAQRRLVFFNHGCERLTGWTAADLLGQKCDYVSEAEINTTAALLAALSPPPEAWTGKPTLAPTSVPHRTGPALSRIVHHFPLVDEDQHVKAVLGVMIPVPEPPVVRSIPAVQRLHAELAVLRQAVRQRFGDGSLIGRSPAILRAFGQIRLAQASQASVLFVGESGSGKQHLARIMHYQSPLGRKAFVPVDCRKTSRQELEQLLSRLRANPDSEALRTGAIYFQDIDAAPTDFQLTLDEWLKKESVAAGIRILAGATRSLKPLVEAEHILADLFFALTTLQVEVPPLRDRMEDLEPLAQHFLEELNRNAPEQVGGLTDNVWRQFRRYNWPGNVEELRRVIAEARSECTAPVIGAEHLPFRFRTGTTAQSIGPAPRARIVPLDQLLEQVEREQIEQALSECHDNKARAADLLGITRPRLYRRMEVLGIAMGEDSGGEASTAPPPNGSAQTTDS